MSLGSSSDMESTALKHLPKSFRLKFPWSCCLTHHESLPGPATTRRGDGGPRLRRGHQELHDAVHAPAFGPSLIYGLAHGQACGIGTKEVGYCRRSTWAACPLTAGLFPETRPC